MLLRIDLIFSYWLLAWYFAYIAKLTPFNPKLGLILGIIENLIMLVAFVYYGTDKQYIGKFSIINFFIKIVPLYTIYNTKIKIKDFYALIVYFALYVLWVHINGGTVYGYLKNTFDSIQKGKNETPIMWAISKLQKILEKY